jgi:hypothetical protein
MDNQLTLEELVDLVQNDVTVNCALPKLLPDDAIKRIATQKGLRYFYRYYKYALQRSYYYVDLISMYSNKRTDSKFFYLPNEIEAIKWIYMVDYKEFRNMGSYLPSGSIGFGATGSNYVAQVTVSEWAESASTMNLFYDALAAYSKNTVKFHFDTNSKRFEVMTSLNKNLILEVEAHIPAEAMFGDPLFIKWVTGHSYIDYARIIGYDDMPQAGDVKINYDKYYEIGQAMITDVEEQIKSISRVVFINKTR